MAQRTCYACGTPAPAGAQFCRYCGRDLDPEGPPEGEEEGYVEPAPPPNRKPLLIAAIVAAVIGGVIAAIVLSGGGEKAKTVAAPPPAKVDPNVALRKQALIDLDAVMRLARQGRAALAAGKLDATTKNRAAVVAALDRIKAPKGGDVATAIVALRGAFAFALKLDKTCGLKCSPAQNKQANTLKVAAVGQVNPLLKAGPGTSYAPGEI